MRIFFSLFTCLLLLSACSNDNNPDADLLAQPPYDKITDSISRQPNDAGLHFHRGTLLYRTNQMEAAIRDLRTAWQLDPQEPYALRLTTVLKTKNADSAIVFIQQAIKKLPSSVSLQIELIKGYQFKKMPAEAMQACDRILAQFPGELDATMIKSDLLKEEDKYSESLALLEQAYAYAPNDVELVHTLAFDYAEAKNPRALVLSDSLIKADHDHHHPEPYYFKGVYFYNTGNPDEAIRQFDAAIQHDFKYMDAYINKGSVYYDQKKYKEALKVFDLATTVFPKDSEPYHWLAKTQEALGLKDEARLNYSRAEGLAKAAQSEESFE